MGDEVSLEQVYAMVLWLRSGSRDAESLDGNDLGLER